MAVICERNFVCRSKPSSEYDVILKTDPIHKGFFSWETLELFASPPIPRKFAELARAVIPRSVFRRDYSIEDFSQSIFCKTEYSDVVDWIKFPSEDAFRRKNPLTGYVFYRKKDIVEIVGSGTIITSKSCHFVPPYTIEIDVSINPRSFVFYEKIVLILLFSVNYFRELGILASLQNKITHSWVMIRVVDPQCEDIDSVEKEILVQMQSVLKRLFGRWYCVYRARDILNVSGYNEYVYKCTFEQIKEIISRNFPTVRK